MNISKKLYVGFAALLAILFAQAALTFVVTGREQRTSKELQASLDVALKTSKVRTQMLQNRLYLRNYLLSGDTREIERLREGTATLNELTNELNRVASTRQRELLAAAGDA